MNRTTLVALLLLIGFALAPANAATAQEAGEQGMRPDEVKAAQLASHWVLGAQQQERAIAETLDPEGFAQEVARLRRAVRELQDSERAERLAAALPAGRTLAPESASASLAAKRPERRQQALEGADRLASRRAALTSRLTDIPSARQRRVARAMAAKLAALEQELRDAVNAPDRERPARLGALQRRLAVERTGVDADPPIDRTPSFQVLYPSGGPPLRTLEEAP